jgi:hypothetical protein
MVKREFTSTKTLFAGKMRVADRNFRTYKATRTYESHQNKWKANEMNRWMKRRIERSRARCEKQRRG